jgi:UDP:flavonoid glycosyltransferase YjiC (YdhE family)
MHVMFSTWTGRGHINHMVALARRLVAGGHTVSFVIIGREGERFADLEAHGIQVIVLPLHPRPPAASPEISDWQRLVAHKRRIMIELVPAQVDAILDLVSRLRPSVMVCPNYVYPPILAATHAQVPLVCMSCELSILVPLHVDTIERRTATLFADDVRTLFSQYGLVDAPFYAWEYLTKDSFVLSTRELAVDAPPLPNVRLVGPSVDADTDSATLPLSEAVRAKVELIERSSLPIVYAAEGSILNWNPALLANLFEALGSLNVLPVVSVKAAAALTIAEQSRRAVVFRGDAPQRQILERASVFVTHGGGSSMMEGIFAGTPLLVLPIMFDQPLSAYLAQRAGIGIGLAQDIPTVAQLRSALESLLDLAGSYRARARQVRDSYLHTDGTAAVLSTVLERATM